MKKARRCIQLMLAVGLLVTIVVPLSSWSESEDPLGQARASIGNARTLQTAYARWKAELTRLGSDRTLVLPLRYTKGISDRFTRASGRASLDLNDGSLSVEVSGLSSTEAYDVWLIDNRPGAGQSVRVESRDRTILAGTLRSAGTAATLQTRLDATDFRGFKVDLLIVTPSGSSPVSAILISGSPSLFQRMLFSERRALGDLAFAQLIPAPAFAGELLTLDTFEELVAQGESLFVNETFGGNGRTCATCHPPANNFTIDPAFIATLPAGDALFVAERNPGLAGLEDSAKLRNFALIRVNHDGFERPGVFRSVSHTLAQSTSIATGATGAPFQATGWSGDGAPASGTLRDFPIGAIAQHAPQTLNRVAGVDFRLPTDEELDALEAFTLSLGRSEDFDLDSMKMLDAFVETGRLLYMTTDSNGGQQRAGKCNVCHRNAGALSSLNPGVNDNFDTGVENLLHPAGILPRDGGRGACSQGGTSPCGDGTFNVPPLVEAADTGGFFHNNQSTTLRDAIQAYSSGAFQSSPAGQLLRSLDSGGVAIDTSVGGGAQIEAFLTVLNALENIRSAIAYQEKARSVPMGSAQLPLSLALADVDDALQDLVGQRLHPDAQTRLESARALTESAKTAANDIQRHALLDQAAAEERTAAGLMVKIGTKVESTAAEDGRIRETAEATNTGGVIFATATVVQVGDDQVDRQSRVILSFDTSGIPDFIPIRGAMLELTNSGINGANPFATLGPILVDVKNGSFGAVALEPGDFEAPASAAGVATITSQGASGTMFTVDLTGAVQHINTRGHTQLRLAFSLDDNDNSAADSAGFFSSDSPDPLRRPRLHLTLGGSDNEPPSFSSDPIAKPNGQENEAYNGSVAGDASDPDSSDVLEFARVSGPTWLTVGASGVLSGTPGHLDIGVNSWTIQVSDGRGGIDQAALSISVNSEVTGLTTRIFESIAAEDGRIRETAEESNTGGPAAAAGGSLMAGDDPLDRQVMFVVSFDTSSVPSSATLVSATLEMTRAGSIGPDPFATLGSLMVDMKNGTFGSAALEPSDFQAPASAAGVAAIGNQGGGGTVFRADLAGGLAAINKAGRTQLRLRFSQGDNDNSSSDQGLFFSSESPTPSTRPRLIVTFQ